MNTNNPLTSTTTMLIEANKWAQEAMDIAGDYAGMPEYTTFLTFARRFAAIAKAYPTAKTETDGMVVFGDIK